MPKAVNTVAMSSSSRSLKKLNEFIKHFNWRSVKQDASGRSYQTGSIEDWVEVDNLLPKGFSYVEGWASAYRAVWISDQHLSVVTFCEEDLSVLVYSTVEGYQKTVQDCHHCYVVQGNGNSVLDEKLNIATAAIAQLDDGWKKLKLRKEITGEVIATSFDDTELWNVASAYLKQNPHAAVSIHSLRSSIGFGARTFEIAQKEWEQNKS